MSVLLALLTQELVTKRAASPSKPGLIKKAKLAHNVHSGSAPPPSSRPSHPPSRLGRPPISKAHSASPVPQHSPTAKRYREDSVTSVSSVGRKTVPVPGFNGPGANVAGKTVPGAKDDGDESSEADDDY